jgi:hypothetical protein
MSRAVHDNDDRPTSGQSAEALAKAAGWHPALESRKRMSSWTPVFAGVTKLMALPQSTRFSRLLCRQDIKPTHCRVLIGEIMEPLFILNWAEFSVIDSMSRTFKKKAGFSFFVPVSRQEKGIDFILFKRLTEGRHCEKTFQVKASKDHQAQSPKALAHGGWFKKFQISDHADFCIFVVHYLEIDSQTNVRRNSLKILRPCILIFDRDETRELLSGFQQKSDRSRPENNFYIRFDNAKAAFLTRGEDKTKDLSQFLLSNRTQWLRDKFS